MKKICFMTPVILSPGGAATHVIEVWKRIPNYLKFQVYLLVIEGRNNEQLSKIKNLKIIELPKPFRKIRTPFIQLLFFQLYFLIYCLKLNDLILLYTRYTTINKSEIIISKLKQIPLITEVNGIYRYEKKDTLGNKFKIFFNELLMRILFRSSSKIITVTDNLKKIVNQEYHISNGKIKVVYNGVDTKFFYPLEKSKCRSKIDLDQNSKIVTFIGGLAIWQGVEDLIQSAPEVIKKYPDTKFLIVGSGPMEAELKAKVKKLRLILFWRGFEE